MSLRKRALSATRWTTLSTTFRAGLQFLQVIILARLLSPEDFGLMAIAMAYYSILYMFADLGLSSALIHFPKPSEDALSSLYWANITSAIILTALFCASAWPLSALYAEPALLPVFLAMSLGLVFSAFGLQFRVMAEKELRFSSLAPLEMTAALIGFIAGVLVATADGGVYALITSSLVTAFGNSALAFWQLSKGLRPKLRFHLPEIATHLRYGIYRLGDMVCNSLHGQADVIIGGAIVGTSNIGVYAVPKEHSLRIANTIVNPIVTRVGLPLMATIQHDLTQLKSVYLKTLHLTSSVNFLIYVGIAVWAEEISIVLLGPQWNGATFFFRIFALWGLIRSIGNPVGSLLYATGNVRRAFWWNFSILLSVPVPIFLASQLSGASGLAWTMLSIQLILFVPGIIFLAKPACGVSTLEVIHSIFPSLLTAAIAHPTGYLISHDIVDSSLLTLLLGGFTTTIMYLSLSWYTNKSWLTLLASLARISNLRRN